MLSKKKRKTLSCSKLKPSIINYHITSYRTYYVYDKYDKYEI
jgi:hypothetical protein